MQVLFAVILLFDCTNLNTLCFISKLLRVLCSTILCMNDDDLKEKYL